MATAKPPAVAASNVNPIPPTAPKSFASVLQNKSPPLSKSLPSNPELIPKSEHLGDPACLFSDEQIAKLSAHYSNALVGKFTKGRLTMEELELAFKTVGFTGKYQLGSLDYKHVLIRFELVNDYQRCWMKGVWNLNGVLLKMLKWSPYFSTRRESPIVPIWCTIREVPLYYYNSSAIEAIGNNIGSFIKNDLATDMLTRPSAIKFCVEIDIQKPLCNYIRLGSVTNNRKYPIEFEDIPLYCNHCSKLGHSSNQCRAASHIDNGKVKIKATTVENNITQNQQWQATGNRFNAPPLISQDEPSFSGNEKACDQGTFDIPTLNLDSIPSPEINRVNVNDPSISPIPSHSSQPQEDPENSISRLLNVVTLFKHTPISYAKDDIQIGSLRLSLKQSPVNNHPLSFGKQGNRFSLLQDLDGLPQDNDESESVVPDDEGTSSQLNTEASNPGKGKNSRSGKTKLKKNNYFNQLNRMMLRSATKSYASSDQ